MGELLVSLLVTLADIEVVSLTIFVWIIQLPELVVFYDKTLSLEPLSADGLAERIQIGIPCRFHEP
ncbi:MAG: hypothetical protein JRF02_00455 [Deltaproteobacteria bacterium]|jgi:hypothetical protein|nr:hypothetical protein [Deltaproteobacteria bacterium]